MGRMMGLEPTNTGTTIRGLNHLATPAIILNLRIIIQKTEKKVDKILYKFVEIKAIRKLKIRENVQAILYNPDCHTQRFLYC